MRVFCCAGHYDSGYHDVVTVPALYAGLEEGVGVKELLMVVHFALVFVLPPLGMEAER
jgi:hypothetical protein